ncbi:hypothetical protein ACMA1D_01995 [Streptomyces sp. 796.1]|uniref:hypothetical protein n=1 Tax=Streptomyces sp. 796.1 TaxID=3163029 RepID=UPI0039C95AD6
MNTNQGLSDADIEARMAAAASAHAAGRHRDATHLYDQLARDIQRSRGQFDPHALDAFEAVARVIASLGK